MSFLAHMCKSCNHPDFHHDNRARRPGEGGCSYGWCFCSGDFESEPVVIETWPLGHPAQVEPLIEPGQMWNNAAHRLTTCKCAACVERYRELVA